MGRPATRKTDQRVWVPGVLAFLAFVAPGAWMVTTLPPAPIARAFSLLTVALWVIAFGLGMAQWARPERRVVLALAGLAAAILASYVLGGSLFQVAFYDLYGNMPLVQWLSLPLVFLLAAGLVSDRERLEDALVVLVLFGAVLAGVEAFQQITTDTPRVFGSTGYSKAALAPLVPLGAAIAASRSGTRRVVLYGAAALIALDVGLFAGSTMGSLVAVFALLVAVAVHPVSRAARGIAWRAVRGVAVASAVAMVAVTLFAQIPALSGRWVNPESLQWAGTSVVSRLQMWQGAQAMVGERPVFGFGPGGYRMAAAEYLPAEALQYGPDRQGNIDPTVYSPQSPHSILWEAATRLGLAGVVALVVLLAAWVAAVVGRLRSDVPGASLRLGLAAGFATAAFAVAVDPVIFATGLLAPVLAGLAIAPSSDSSALSSRVSRGPSALIAAGGVVIALVALWLGVGEWRLMTTWSEDPTQLKASVQSTLKAIPRHPQAERQLWELELLLADSDERSASVQAGVDAAPSYISGFAPNLVSLAAYSLSQAERTGRSDLSWEDRVLTEAATRLPPIPSLVAERLHLAVLTGDSAKIRTALAEAERWGGPYPFTEAYIGRAREVLEGGSN